MFFEVSQVTVSPAIPFTVAFVISFLTSMAGVSGAFLLLPFQVSFLGFTSPSVSATNHLYNLVAIPGGVYRFFKEGRMVWPLAWIIIAGTLPGVFIGAFIRIKLMPDPKVFKLFVGAVLLYIGIRLVIDIFKKDNEKSKEIQKENDKITAVKVTTVSLSFLMYRYSYKNKEYSVNTPALMCLTLVVGIIGGAYGIGGGAIIAPFLVTFFRLPVHTIAGATLLGTFVTSLFGVVFFIVLGQYFSGLQESVSPDWLLGFLFGAGGFAGIYVGARLQKYMPEKGIKIVLCLIILSLSVKYTAL